MLGAIYTKMGESRRGEPYLREALTIRQKVMPKGYLLISLPQGALGECLRAPKRYAEAEPLLLESYNDLKTSQGEQNPKTMEALQRLVSLYEAWGKPAQTAPYRAMLPESRK